MKSYTASFLLTLFLGPFGNFYSSIMAGFWLLIISILVSTATAGAGMLIMWPICIIAGASSVAEHNSKITAAADLAKKKEAKMDRQHRELLAMIEKGNHENHNYYHTDSCDFDRSIEG